MPEGPLWVIRNPRETWGTTETINSVIGAIESVERQFPSSPRIVIGEISRSEGGRLNWHASHQVGRDVDSGFYHRAEVTVDEAGADEILPEGEEGAATLGLC